ncbi:unnamed protein product [Caenorhabditis sp. 36 PRJEB53466]|nr:unnamed protein product [Caenorhabditis sp. 36 PRJEB53466]
MPRVKILKRTGTHPQPEQKSAKKPTPEKTGTRKTDGKRNTARKNLKANLEEEPMEQLAFEDESSSLAASAIENYFMQGKTAAECMNTARVRRGRRAANAGDDEAEEDEDVDSLTADFTKCDLPGLRDYIVSRNESDSVIEQRANLERTEFDKWVLYLASGFNILIHGVGSKREVLTKWAQPKALLSAINKHMSLNQNIRRGQSTSEWARAIRRNLKRAALQLILIIDNIEAPDWRNDQEALCELLEDRDIVKLIATVDHVYSTFIWNSRQISTLSFVHITVNTFEIPFHELMTGESRLLGLDARSNQSSHTISSLDVFWKSLASNSQKLFRLFFQMYFETKKPVKFWDLFNAAKDDFIASTDAALRTQLVEFKDHRVLKWTRGDDGNDQLSGMVELKLVTEFLESKGMPLVVEKDE